MKSNIFKSILATAICAAAASAPAESLLFSVLDAASSVVDAVDTTSKSFSATAATEAMPPPRTARGKAEAERLAQEKRKEEETKRTIQEWKPATLSVKIGSSTIGTILSLKPHTYAEWEPQGLDLGGSATIRLQSVPRPVDGGVDAEKPLWFGQTEVTQAQWEAVMGRNPSCFKSSDNPVERVSWDDCLSFLEKLNAMPSVKASGLTFRLPTEEEWEFACRAGSTGDFCRLADGDEISGETLGTVAWFEGNSNGRPQPVGRKKPNAFGLFDMLGNVWEWTSTESNGHRVYRGGAWSDAAGFCGASYRCRFAPDFRLGCLGLRLCATKTDALPPPPESTAVSLPTDNDETEK